MERFVAFVAAIFFLSGCNQTKQNYLPESSGKINSLAIVIDDALWRGDVGDTLRAYFAQPLEGIPSDQEPIFTIHQIPPQIFKDNTRNSRNILVVDKGTQNLLDAQDTLYAKPQKVVHLQAKSDADLIKQVRNNAQGIINMFQENELKESQKRFRKSLTSTAAIEQKLGIKLTVPSVYSIVKQENNFFWLERRLKGGTADILIYEMPLTPLATNPTDLLHTLIAMRDSIGERYVPGPEQGMYMVTGTAFAPFLERVHVADAPALESRGLWEIKDFLLGGPFINYMIEDPKHNRYLVIEGFVSAPGVPKRDYLFELEAIIKSIKFLN